MMVYLGFIARILFASVFLAAALGKAHNSAEFLNTIRSIGFRLRLAQVIAWLTIGYEAMLGVLFALGIFPILATLAASLLLALFASVSIRAAWSHQNIPCNCFGETETPLGNQTLIRAILLAFPVIVYYLSTRSTSTIWWPTTIDTFVSLISLVIATILLTRWLFMSTTLTAFIRERERDEHALTRRRIQELEKRLQ